MNGTRGALGAAAVLGAAGVVMLAGSLQAPEPSGHQRVVHEALRIATQLDGPNRSVMFAVREAAGVAEFLVTYPAVRAPDRSHTASATAEGLVDEVGALCAHVGPESLIQNSWREFRPLREAV